MALDGRKNMEIREVLVSALTDRFADRGMRVGAPPGPIATFPATHPAVGDVSVAEAGTFSAIVQVGEIVWNHVHSYDDHLEADERLQRLTQEVVRFLEELFADRLLFWRSTDGRNAGWRERGDVGHLEPLVLDNRIYQPYLWSGPLPVWQAVPAIFARGRIRNDREYEIVAILLEERGAAALDDAERDLARRVAAEYQREPAV
jgi:hypothetical protein